MQLKLFFLYLICFLSTYHSFSQVRPENVRLFIDCRASCDQNFIKTEIHYINYVNDRFQANVHILITSQNTGSGGREYKLQITGQGPFEGMSDTLSYIREATATDDDDRRLAVGTIRLGIFPYLFKTEKAKDMLVSLKEQEDLQDELKIPEKDPWNFWVFSIEAEGSFEGEKNYSSRNIEGGFSASHVTDKLKVDFRADANHETNRYGEGADEFQFTNKSYDFDNTTVWSLSPRLSAGGSVSMEQSDYQNYKLAFSLTPAIEYNFFPYKESTNRSLTLMYRIGPQYFNYYEETIYLKTKEMRLQESLSLEMRYNKAWGEISGATSFSHYFHDFSKNRLSFNGNVELRVFKGFFFNFGGSYSFQRDQLNIVKGDVTDQDLLTRRRELNSDFDFNVDFGVRYRFGSLFNNIVNPRFDDSDWN